MALLWWEDSLRSIVSELALLIRSEVFIRAQQLDTMLEDSWFYYVK